MSALRPHRRALLAAARLGAIYATGVLALFLPLFLATANRTALLEDLRRVAATFGALFALAFVVLAVARRFGFALLWLLVLGVWGSDVRTHGWYDDALNSAFFGWTLLAAPLLAMQTLGMPPRPEPVPRWRRVAAGGGVALWLAGVAGGFMDPHASYVPFDAGYVARLLLPLVWLPGPLVVTALALAGLRRLKPAPDELADPP